MEYALFKEKFTVSLSQVKEINKGTVKYVNNVQELIITNIETQEIINTEQFYKIESNLSQENLYTIAFEFFNLHLSP